MERGSQTRFFAIERLTGEPPSAVTCMQVLCNFPAIDIVKTDFIPSHIETLELQ